MIKSVSIALSALILAACSTLPVYHPASKIGDTGFSEQKLADTHYRVTFQGDSQTSRHDVEDYLLFRAAELTDEKGYDYFIISERDVEKETQIITTRRPALYSRLDHLHGHRIYTFPYYAYGYDWGHPYEIETREYSQYSALAYIDMYRGEKPQGNSRAFDATDIMDSLGPVDCWNTKAHDEEGCRLAH